MGIRLASEYLALFQARALRGWEIVVADDLFQVIVPIGPAATKNVRVRLDCNFAVKATSWDH